MNFAGKVTEGTVNPGESPFYSGNQYQYEKWKEKKLHNYPMSVSDLLTAIDDPRDLRPELIEKMRRTLRKTNMALYAGNTGNNPDKEIPLRLGRAIGVELKNHNMCADDEGITALQVHGSGVHSGYIPYSNREIHWHTDGYYNTVERTVRSLHLHCVRKAIRGGENYFMDHEIIFIMLREENKDFVTVLQQPDVMSIPANIVNGEVIRAGMKCPVFSINSDGSLQMRYTERTRFMGWKQDKIVLKAVDCIKDILSSESSFIFHGTLEPGQGFISNNVLHTRTSFEDDESASRLLYRIRYFDRIN